jgi:SAM-dependent methyltransferase
MIERRGSYRLQEHFADIEGELVRLEAQVARFWPKESEVLRRRGLSPDARLLELGCGPGFATERPLTLLPDGSITGIDNDPRMVEVAGSRLAALERVDILVGSVSGAVALRSSKVVNRGPRVCRDSTSH